MLPNLFIIGVQKSGTTALHHLLNQHPDVFFPRAPQELHFFDVEENLCKGLAWYEKHFIDWKGQRIIGQTSPLYFFEPAVPARIHAVIPKARFIVILRNPIDRAYSHYWHEVKHGAETLPFEEALNRESERIQVGFEGRRHFSYVSRGEYSTQIARYLALFPREQLLALRFEDLVHNVAEIFRRCANFLEIPLEGFAQARQRHGVRNAAQMPRSRVVHDLGRRLGKIFPAVGNAIVRLNLSPRKYPEMQSETRRSLQRRLERDILQTASLTGLDLRSWLE